MTLYSDQRLKQGYNMENNTDEITSDEKITTDISCRIAQAKQMFFKKKKKLFATKTLNINIRKTLIKTIVLKIYCTELKYGQFLKIIEK